MSNSDESWRWLGGRTTETTIFLEITDTPDRAILYGQPMQSNEIRADVYLDGTRTDSVTFHDRSGSFDPYNLTLQ